MIADDDHPIHTLVMAMDTLGIPHALIDVGELIDEGQRMAYKLAAASNDPDEWAQIELESTYGTDPILLPLVYVAVAYSLLASVIEPMLTSVDKFGNHVRVHLQHPADQP